RIALPSPLLGVQPLMDLRAVVFDVNGTLIDIETDESQDDLYRQVGRFLQYQGVAVERDLLRDRFFAKPGGQKKASAEAHPEVDVVAAWRSLLNGNGRKVPEGLPLLVAQFYRTLSRRRLQLFPEVLTVLGQLRDRYRLAIVSDHQQAYALPEI